MKCAYESCVEDIKGQGNYCDKHALVSGKITKALYDDEMEAEGAADRTGGKIQEGYGEAKRKVGDAIKDVGDVIRN